MEEYLPRLAADSVESNADDVDTSENDDEEFEYVMIPQSIKSAVSADVVKAFLNDTFAPLNNTVDDIETMKSEDYFKPLLLVCGPPRMVVCFEIL
jgi:hypothetical protein